MNKPIIKLEKEFSEWFKKNYKKYGFSEIVKHNVSTSPDYIMIKGNKEVGVELETLSSNFITHKHQIDKIDFVVCLVKDLDLGIPIIVVDELEYKPKYRRVTLSINDKVYANFQKVCKENDIILSKRVERLMKLELERNKETKKGVKK